MELVIDGHRVQVEGAAARLMAAVMAGRSRRQLEVCLEVLECGDDVDRLRVGAIEVRWDESRVKPAFLRYSRGPR